VNGVIVVDIETCLLVNGVIVVDIETCLLVNGSLDPISICSIVDFRHNGNLSASINNGGYSDHTRCHSCHAYCKG